jgi:TetR/AcrR family transcriptional regulator
MTNSKVKTAKPRGRPRQSDSDIPTVIQIATAALIEFATHGYEGAKISCIAKRAGVVTPAVHYHYKTKLELWKAAVDHSFKEYDLLANTVQSDLRDLDPISILKVIIRRYITIAFNSPERIRIILLESLRDNERSQWLIDKHILPSHKVLKPYFEQLVRAGIIKPYSGLSIISILGGAVVSTLSNANTVGKLYDFDDVNDQLITESSDAITDILLNGILKV